MSAEFAIGEMTCFETAMDGSSIRLDMNDVSGGLVSLHMPIECLNRLLMTIPGMVTKAIQYRHSDPTLRVVYPVSHVNLELAGDLHTRILTLATPDGFRVSFGLSEDQCQEIGTDSMSDAAGEFVMKIN